MDLRKTKSDYLTGRLDKRMYIRRMHRAHKALFAYSGFMRGTDMERLEISPEGVVATLGPFGVRMLLDPSDMRTAPLEVLNFDSYEKRELEAILCLLDDGSNVFDIGANHGWYSLNLSKMRRRCRIFAFEPVPDTFGYLERNISLNGAKNVRTYNLGLSNAAGRISFYFDPASSGSASGANIIPSKGVRKITCKIMRLDDFTAKNRIRVDFIKCDVEGAELFVFEGAVKTIEKDKPVIFAEMLRKWSAKFGYHPNDIISLLAGMGYGCYAIGKKGVMELSSMDEATAETNFIFLHAVKHKDKIKAIKKVR